VYLFELEPWL